MRPPSSAAIAWGFNLAIALGWAIDRLLSYMPKPRRDGNGRFTR